MDERLNKFLPREGFGVCGSGLDSIARCCAEIYGSKVIKINVPYHGFNCHGPATEIAKEATGVMPFTKAPLPQGAELKTMFYGAARATLRNYLPFLSEADVYFVESVTDADEPELNLIKGPCWREYL